MASKLRVELCSECDGNAKWYCIQDEANFCDEHNTVAHSLKSQKSHKIVPINEKDDIIKRQTAKPMNCKSHHMPLCLYCLSCRRQSSKFHDVCCVACLSVDIHKQHSNQVKSVVDIANEQKKTLNEHLGRLQKLQTTFADEQKQLQKMLKNIGVSETKTNQEIDKEFDRIIERLQARRKFLKTKLQEKSKTYRDNIHLRQEDIKNIDSSLNRCLEEAQHVLTLDDFAALSQLKTIIQKMRKLDTDSDEYRQQVQLTDSIPIFISSYTILEMINTLGTVGAPPTPTFIRQKCKAKATDIKIEWESLDYQPLTGYVLELGQDNNNFNEVYRGLETQYHLGGLKPSTSYVLRLYACNQNEVSHTAILEMKTPNHDLNNWTLSISSSYAPLNAENTRESLLDGNLATGAATNLSGGNNWIQATFSCPVPVTSVTIAPLHKNNGVWGPTNGTGGSLQYSHGNNNWTTAGTITYVEKQPQTIAVGKVTAQHWRLFSNGYLGTSSFIFQ